MKRLLLLSFLLLVLLCGCTARKQPYLIRFYDSSGTLVHEEEIASPEVYPRLSSPDITVGGRTRLFSHWTLEINEAERLIIAHPFYTDDFPRSQCLADSYDILYDVLMPDALNHLLVIRIGFEGEPAPDRERFEAFFTGQYGPDDALRSVKSYFFHNSYGRGLLDFQFVYYDCPMTVEEAWHYVNDEDEYGNFVGNDFLFDIFDELKTDGRIDTSSLDANRDGYADAVLFLIADDPESTGHYLFGGAEGHTSLYDYKPDVSSPVLGKYLKVSCAYLDAPLEKASYGSQNTRILIHEVSHLFGAVDYYDCASYEGSLISSLGDFDMQCADTGDWNPFTKLCCGWLEPYVITADTASVTLKLRCSSLYGDAVLIPTSLGWNGTPFDEYLLVDVLAPAAANGFDWGILTENAERITDGGELRNTGGGVRILHVDARLQRCSNGEFTAVSDPLAEAATAEDRILLGFAFTNSNGFEPNLETDSRFYHLLDWIPADGSSKFRLSTPPTGPFTRRPASMTCSLPAKAFRLFHTRLPS